MNVSEATHEAVVVDKRARKKQARKATESEAVRLSVMARRTARMPIILKGVLPGKLRRFKPDEFGNLDYDQRYQREKITAEVNNLIYVLQNGGEIPEAIVLGKRLYAEGGNVSKKFWIIDGLQRFLAHMEVGVPVRAIVHEIESLEAERNFFIVKNTHVRVSPNHMVQSATGKTADAIRYASDSSSHSLFDRVNFGQGGNTRIGAAIIARGVSTVLTGRKAKGPILEVLSRGDMSWKDDRQSLRVAAFLSVLGRTFQGYAPSMAVEAIGYVAAIRWEKLIEGPNEAQIARLRKTNWSTVVPSMAGRFFGVMTSHVERIWR